MHHIDQYEFSGKRALIRVDFNVPLNNQNEITDDTRIRAVLPTLRKILDAGGSVVIMSHLGRPFKKLLPDGTLDVNRFSLQHLVKHLSKCLGCPVAFAEDCIGESAFRQSAGLKAGEVLLLENLRFHREETKGDEAFAQKLARHGDVYVNDAFGTAHRAHASTAVIAARFPTEKLFGYLIEKEIESVAQVVSKGKKPVTAIIGGAKVSSKIIIIRQLLDKIDNLVIGGGMAYTFAKAQGGKVGSSLVEEEFLDTANELLQVAEEKGVCILLPSDSVVADAFSDEANRQTCSTLEIPDGWMGLDIGPEATREYVACIENSRTLLWNGPMGVFEMDAFQSGTKATAYAVAKATEQGAFSLVGGGDSVAAVNKYHLAEQVNHVSTGGGAMLEYLEGKVLPGIAAISGEN